MTAMKIVIEITPETVRGYFAEHWTEKAQTQDPLHQRVQALHDATDGEIEIAITNLNNTNGGQALSDIEWVKDEIFDRVLTNIESIMRGME
jgi:hypothetical protein